ncbi:MAG: ANTAR domain-containing protein [Oscillospiraceae bacterium]|jgi:response regulator NasT|nr:ANTAR domain-containing protein [Oscillospiraceae bacterium]
MEKTLIVSSSEKAMESIARFLHGCGYTDITHAVSGSEARRLTGTVEYALIIVNTPLTDEFGHELAVTLAEHTGSGILLLCRADIADDVADKVSDYGVCVISRPVSRELLHQSVRIVEATRSRMLSLKRENTRLMLRIEEMRIIGRAKLALVQNLGLSEPEAHRRIEKQAMDTRCTRREVAQDILAQFGQDSHA